MRRSEKVAVFPNSHGSKEMNQDDRINDLAVRDEAVKAELYEDLLNRYERVLVFAGQLQEKLKRQRHLVEENEALRQENERLRRLASVAQSYIHSLEEAVQVMGLVEFPVAGEKRRKSA